MTRLLRTLVPLCLLAISAPVLHAQAHSGPSLSRAAVGVRAARARPGPGPIARAASVPRKVESNQNRAMIIVGGVALVVGAIIGDTPGTIIMVGGAGVGLYGLYKYLE